MTNIDIDKLFNSAKQDALPLQRHEVEGIVKNYKVSSIKVSRFKTKIIFSALSGIIVIGSILVYHFKSINQADEMEVRAEQIETKEIIEEETDQIDRALYVEEKEDRGLVTIEQQKIIDQELTNAKTVNANKWGNYKSVVFAFPSKLATNQRIIKKTVDVSDLVHSIIIRNYAGHVVLKKWDKNVVQLRALLTVYGHNDEDVQLCLENLNVGLEKNPEGLKSHNHFGDYIYINPINLSSGLNNKDDIFELIKMQESKLEPSNNTLKHGQIVFANGQKVKVKKFTIDYEVTVPENARTQLIIRSLEHNVDIVDAFTGNIIIGIRNAQLNAIKHLDTLSVTLKSSVALINSFDQGKLNVKNSTVILKKGGEVILSGGKSNVDLQEVKTLDDKGFKKDEAYKYSISYKK